MTTRKIKYLCLIYNASFTTMIFRNLCSDQQNPVYYSIAVNNYLDVMFINFSLNTSIPVKNKKYVCLKLLPPYSFIKAVVISLYV